MAASPIDPETKAAVRRHVETTTWPLADIARDGGVSLRTVNDWITRGRWRRPNVTARPALTPERLDATRRGYEAGLRALDLGILNGRSRSWMAKLAQAKGWRRPGTPAGASQPEDGAVRAASRPELAAIEAALLSDPLDRAELIPLVERATAVAAADALTGRDPQAEARLAWLARAAAIVKSLPEREARPGGEDRCHPDGIAPFTFIETERLIEDIALRFEEFCRTENLEELLGEPGAACA